MPKTNKPTPSPTMTPSDAITSAPSKAIVTSTGPSTDVEISNVYSQALTGDSALTT